MREWLTVLTRELFDQRNALFEPAANGVRLQPCEHSHVNPDHLSSVQFRFLDFQFDALSCSYFAFAGRILALTVVHEQLLDVRFTVPFYKQLLGLEANIDDVRDTDADVARNLQWLVRVARV